MALAAPNLLNAKAHRVYATELAKIPNDNKGNMYELTLVIFDGSNLSIMITTGMKYIIPMTFCTNVIVNGLYNNVNFLNEIEYPTATTTALNKNITPLTDIVSSKFLFTNMKITPKNDTIKPNMFQLVNRSFRKKYAAIGVNNGIVAIIAELTTADEFINP